MTNTQRSTTVAGHPTTGIRLPIERQSPLEKKTALSQFQRK